MKLGFVTLDWSNLLDADGHMTPGGAGWYRLIMPARFLLRNGVDVVYGADVAQERSGALVVKDLDNQNHYGCDVIVFQRWMSYEAADIFKMARAAGQVIINDIDDHFDAIDPGNRAFRMTHPRTDPLNNRNHYKRAIMASSAITVSTHALAHHYEGTGKPVHVLENCIDLERWEQRAVGGEPVVGWVGGTGFRSGDLEILRGVLGPFLRSNGVTFHHSGHAAGQACASDLLALGPEVEASTSPMCSIEDYPKLFDAFNIGIVPLAPKAFNDAKSHIKGLEYAASGIPFVASSTREYFEFCRTGAGRVATRRRDWQRELGMLLDSQTRISGGNRARAVAERYDMTHRWTDWYGAYESILREAA